MHKRLVSLDAFRGFAIALMIFVNNIEGNTYNQLLHASWNGWTIADTVFPFFLWISGLAMVFSFGNRLKETHHKKEILFHIFKRAVILFILGIALNAFPFFHIASVRIPGVLQRIAVSYLIASMVYLFTGIKGTAFLTVFLLSAYWLLMKFFGNMFPQSVDMFLLKGHLWSETFDPEGIVSTIAATSTVLFGIVTGYFLKKTHNENKKVYLLIVVGIFLIVLGQIMNVWLPINKYLWTSSYSVFMAGMSSLIYAGFYFFIEGKGLGKIFQIFTVFGMNPLLLYVLSELLSKILIAIPIGTDSVWDVIFRTVFLKMSSEKNSVVLFAFTHVILFYIIAYLLYKKKWFVKI